MGAGAFAGRNVAGFNLGHRSDAATDGNFLSTVDITSGFQLLTTGRLSVRPLFSLCWNMRETIPDDVYGARLQCSRGDRLPDY